MSETAPRVTSTLTTTARPCATYASVEFGTDFTDVGPDGSVGFRVTVGWSEEDEAWIARLHDCKAGGPLMGHGCTKEEALCHLACSIALLAEVLQDERARAEEDVPRRTVPFRVPRRGS